MFFAFFYDDSIRIFHVLHIGNGCLSFGSNQKCTFANNYKFIWI